MYIYVLSKDNPKLAMAEMKAQLDCRFSQGVGYSKYLSKRLAYAKHIIDTDILKLVGTYRVLRLKGHASEAEAAGRLGILNKVELKNPDNIIGLVDKQLGLLVWQNDKSYLNRKAHKRPGLLPTSLDPKLARAAINLLGTHETIVDPFCGSGGILIEAGILGHKVVGYDIDKKALALAEKNLQHYNIEHKLYLRSALDMDLRHSHIVTDPPYGRNTHVPDIKKLYSDFLLRLKMSRSRRSVVMFPSNIDHKRIIRKSGLRVIDVFEHYIHKSLKKKICLIENL